MSYSLFRVCSKCFSVYHNKPNALDCSHPTTFAISLILPNSETINATLKFTNICVR